MKRLKGIIKQYPKTAFALLAAILIFSGSFAFEALEIFGFGPLMLNIYTPVTEAVVGGVKWHTHGALILKSSPDYMRVRAWAPSFSIVNDGPTLSPVKIEVANVLPSAEFSRQDDAIENIKGTTRTLVIAAHKEVIRLKWNASPKGPYSFSVIGDIRTETGYLTSMAKDSDFIVILGDLIVEDGQAEPLADAFDQLPVPVYSVIGNHDVEWSREKEYVHTFAPYNYFFNYGDAHYIFLNDAAETFWISENESVEWLEPQIQESSSALKFLFMHVPPFMDINDVNNRKYHAIRSKSVGNKIVQLVTNGGVNAVFCGHIHEFHRWMKNGVPYIISGAGHGEADGSPPKYARITVDRFNFTIEERQTSMIPLP